MIVTIFQTLPNSVRSQEQQSLEHKEKRHPLIPGITLSTFLLWTISFAITLVVTLLKSSCSYFCSSSIANDTFIIDFTFMIPKMQSI